MGNSKMIKRQKLIPAGPALLNLRLERMWKRCGQGLFRHDKYVMKQFNRRWDFWCIVYE